MANWTAALRRAAARIGLALTVGLILLTYGCGKGKKETTEDKSGAVKLAAHPGQEESAAKAPSAKIDPRLRQSFEEATIAGTPDGAVLPEKTMTQKSVGKLYTTVVGLWDKIPLATADGKPLSYRAMLNTHEGPIEITLRPDIAPNHVRSFIALAKAGYYDGLVFERTVHMQADNNPAVKLDYIEGGCPMGTGEENFGSIGYWLKPEFTDKVQHEPGTVGTWHKEEADTAACKFYIALTKAPEMDGRFTIFGKVTKGLDVVRKIAERPLRTDEGFTECPKDPVVIKAVTIRKEGDE